MANRKKSHPWNVATEFRKTQARINRLSINSEDHAEHWHRIGKAMRNACVRTEYDDIVEQHFQQYNDDLVDRDTQDRGTSGNENISQSETQMSPEWKSYSASTRPSVTRGSTRGGLVSTMDDDESSFNREDDEVDSDASWSASPDRPISHTTGTEEVITKSAETIYQQLCCPDTKAAEGRRFPDRQLYIYIVADPTDMRVELAILRNLVWPYLQRMCRSRGFFLHVIDQSVGTDLNPPTCPEMDEEQHSLILEEHMLRRSKQEDFLNSLILLSTQTVGPVPNLPSILTEATVRIVLDGAKREIESLEVDIENLTEKMYDEDEHRPIRPKEFDREASDIPANENDKNKGFLRMDSLSSRATVRAPSTSTLFTEEQIRQKTELIKAYNPDPLTRWYRRESVGNQSGGKGYYRLQSVRTVLPDMSRSEDPVKRQTALECWLQDAHRIRCLLMHYLPWPFGHMLHRKEENLKLRPLSRVSEKDADPASCSVNSTERLGTIDCDWKLLGKSLVEKEIEQILQSSMGENEDCFVAIRCHEVDEEEKGDFPSRDIRSSALSSARSMSVGSWDSARFGSSNTIHTSLSHGNPIHTSYIEAPITESAIRATKLVECARLQVPQSNQVHLDLIVSHTLSLDDRISRKHAPINPAEHQDHASYLDELCRNVRGRFTNSLTEEMERRLDEESKAQLALGKSTNLRPEDIIWSLEYEIEAHWKACQQIAKDFIARNDTLDEIIAWIESNMRHGGLGNSTRTVTPRSKSTPSDNQSGRFHLLTVGGTLGSGKSVLLAKLAQQLTTEDCLKQRPRVIYRHIGSSTLSVSLSEMLRYLCRELSVKMNSITMQDGYDALRNALHLALMEATYQQDSAKPLIVILDDVEHLEEFGQRGINTPLAWLPASWVKHPPRLNCNVFLLVSGSFKRDNKPFTDMGGLLDMISDSNTASKHIQLTPLTDTDRNACLNVWQAQNSSSKNETDAMPMLAHPGTLQPLQLRLLIALADKYSQTTDKPPRMREHSVATLLNCWFQLAETELGQSRVQFVMRHLLASRWGLDNEDILALHRLSATESPGMKLKANAMPRHSLQTGNLNQTLTITPSTSQDLTFHWWTRFRKTYLEPVALVEHRYCPSVGANQLWCLRPSIVRRVLKLRYLDSEPLRTRTYVGLVNLFLKDLRFSGQPEPIQLNWRPLYEIPWYLSHSGQRQRVRDLCWFNPMWLRGMLHMGLHRLKDRPAVQRILDEISLCLFQLHASKWEEIQSDLSMAGSDVSTDGQVPDLHVQVLCKLLDEDTELQQLFAALCSWKTKLQRDPDLLNSLFYTQFHSLLSNSRSSSVCSNETDGTPTMEDHSIPGTPKQLNDINRLIGRITSEVSSHLLLQPVNFELQSSLACPNAIREHFLGEHGRQSLRYSKSTTQVTVMAYSPDSNRLAVGLRDLVSGFLRLDIWSMEQSLMYTSHVIDRRAIGHVEQIHWVTDKAILILETPSQRITVWPIEAYGSPQHRNRVYHQLSETGLSSQGEDCLIHIARTSHPEVAFILCLRLGVYRLHMWCWHTDHADYLPSGMINFIENNRSVRSDQSKPKNSVPLVGKSTADLLMTATVDDRNVLHLICAQKSEPKAWLIPFKVSQNADIWNVSNSGEDMTPRVLQCPNAGARLMGIGVRQTGSKPAPAVLVSRTPKIDPNDEQELVGCVDLFDLHSGALLEHIEAGPTVLEILEASSPTLGLFSHSVASSLQMCFTSDGINLITVATRSAHRGDSAQSQFEAVSWNLNTRTSQTLALKDLLDHAIPSRKDTWSWPIVVGFRGLQELSVCFATKSRIQSCIWKCDVEKVMSRTTVRKSFSVKGQNMPQQPVEKGQIWNDLQINCAEPNDLVYLYQDTDGRFMLGLMRRLTSPTNSGSWYKLERFSVEPEVPIEWSASDQLVLQNRILVVLTKLAYSEVVEECKEVYQRMDIFELIEHPKGTLKLVHKRYLPEVFIIPCNQAGYLVWNKSYLIGLDENRTHFIAWSLKHGQVTWRLKPTYSLVQTSDSNLELTRKDSLDFKESFKESMRLEVESVDASLAENRMIEMFLISPNGALMLATFGLPYICVFCLDEQSHIGNLEEEYALTGESHLLPAQIEGHAMSLSISSISTNAEWFVHTEFVENEGSQCATVWNLGPFLREPSNNKVTWYRKRLPDQRGLMALKVNGPQCTVVSACSGHGIRVWHANSETKKGYLLLRSERLDLSPEANSLIDLTPDGTKVAVVSGQQRRQISAWCVGGGCNQLIGHVTSPERIDDLRLVFPDSMIAVKTENEDEPLLVWPKWNHGVEGK